MKQKGKNPVVVIAGGGPNHLREKYLELARTLDVSENITITGALPHTEMPNLIASADVVTIPSTREAVSLAALEALSCGVPVVASDVGGLPHVIKESNGILVPANSSEELAKALNALLFDHALRLEKGRNGRRLVRESFSWDEVARQTLDFYLTQKEKKNFI